MSSKIQVHLVKQIARQIRMMERKENQRLHRELRHRIRQFQIIEEHFDEQRDDIQLRFNDYQEQIKDAILRNKTRFDLCLNERIENIDYDFEITKISDIDVEKINTGFSFDMNSHLFFGGLYPTSASDSDNTLFYILVFIITSLYTIRMS